MPIPMPTHAPLPSRLAVRRYRTAAACVLLAVAALASFLWPGRAHASGDMGCTPSWQLRHADLTGCDNMAMLTPGNDTRINLALLLARGPSRSVPEPKAIPRPGPLFDWETFKQWTYPSPPELGDADHAAGEGSRCLSDAEGTAAFEAAVSATPQLATAERTALIAARRSLHPSCAGASSGDAEIAAAATMAKSAAGKGFIAYLHGASAFYAGDFDAAATQFAALVGSNQPWLRETARYMIGRVEVNRAQVGAFDEYGYRDEKHQADPKVIADADTRLRAYLAAYPTGHYALSARGLLRRVHWLGGDTAKLASEYAALFAQPTDARGLDDVALAEEIDNKLLPQLTVAETSNPILLAVLDLQLMRGSNEAENGADNKAVITRATLEAQRPRFVNEPALFGHLLAVYEFYVAHDPRAVLRLVPDTARQPGLDTVQFSRQMLRGMALDATGDRNARGFWIDLIRGATPPFRYTTVELALALHDERTAGLDHVFGSDSPVRDATIRDTLLAHVAGPPLLRRQMADASATPHERAVALFTLLYKSLTRGAYVDFVADVVKIPAGAATEADFYNFVGTGNPPVGIFATGKTADDFACPALRNTAQRLAQKPGDPTAQLCLAEFIRLNNLDGFFLDTPPGAEELGGTKSQFPGRFLARLEIYKGVIAGRQNLAADRAYALFRAVNCYAPSQSNSCGGKDVEPSVRKGWFQQLHKEYATSRWAQELRYYW